MKQCEQEFNRRAFMTRFLFGTLTVAGCAGAGGWLTLGSAGEPSPCLRPPGALSEEQFLSRCIRCGRCMDACPNRCIQAFTSDAAAVLSQAPGRGQTGTPVIFPRRQACMLCNGAAGEMLLCTASCPTGALQHVKKDVDSIRQAVRMGIAELDKHLCYSYNGASCGACVRACPFEGHALQAGLWEKPFIDQKHCVGCGLCERACIRYPQAIRVRPLRG